MKFRLKATLAGVLATGLIVAAAGAAFAATPPYEPYGGPNANGATYAPPFGFITFYDSAGNVITGGNVSDANMAAYIGTNGISSDSTDNKITMSIAVPAPNTDPALFNNFNTSVAKTYPPTTGPFAGDAASDIWSSPQNITLSTFIGIHPQTNGGAFAGLYQVRLTTSGPDGVEVNYWESDIQITGNTWSVVYPALPAATTTGTTLTVSPASPQTSGTGVTLTATVGPSSIPGSVQFQSDGANIGPTETVTGGVATLPNYTGLPVGTHSLTAIFTPNAFENANPSTSAPVSYQITGTPPTPTTTGLAVDPGSSQAFAPVTFTATVTPQPGPNGSVTFEESPTGTVIATTPVETGTPGDPAGTYVLVTSSLAQGPHNVIAIFNPAAGNNFTSSQSSAVPFTLGAAGCAGCTDQQTIVGTIPAGTLVITTPYTSSSPLNLGTLALDASGTYFQATATFANIVITDTRAGANPITAKAQSSDLMSGANAIDSQNVGLTGLVPVYLTGNGINGGTNPATTFNNPAAFPPVAPGAAGGAGLGGPTAHTIATVAHGPGSFSMNGTLTLNAPTSTPAGTYTGTITFTVG